MIRMRWLVGVLFVLGVAAGQPGGFGTRMPSRALPSVAVAEAHVQAELKANNEQKEDFALIAKNYFAAARDVGEQEARASAEKKVKELVTPAQYQRLREICAQRAVNLVGVPAYVRTDEARKLLDFTPEQEKRFEKLAPDGAAALKAALLSGGPYEQIVEKVRAVRAAQEQAFRALLTPAQVKTWTATMGKPFADDLSRPARPGGPGTGFPAPTQPLGAGTITYVLIAEPVVQKAVGLNDEQARKVSARSTKETLTGVLTEAQFKRLEQLIYQERAQAGGLAYLLRFRPVAEALALTAEQKKELEPLYQKSVTAAAGRSRHTAEDAKADAAALTKLLTAEQRPKLQAFLGAPFAGKLPAEPRALFPTGSSAARLPTLLAYLGEADVQKELVLVADQVAGAKDALAKLDAKLKEAVPRAERAAHRAAAEKEGDEVAGKLLKAPQFARLEQIRLQHRWSLVRSDEQFFRDPKLATALKLSIDDQIRIEELVADLHRLELLIEREAPLVLGLPQGRIGGAVQELTVAVRDELRVRGLTPEQKQRWQELLGKPYTGAHPSRRAAFR